MKMSKKTNYFTAISILALIFSSLLAIPTLIEGINIARDYRSYNLDGETIKKGEFTFVNFFIKSADRINVEIESHRSTNGVLWIEQLPVIFAVMKRSTFLTWIDLGSPPPSIANSTYYFNRASVDVQNLKITLRGEYVFLLFNDQSEYDIGVFITIAIVPWGHIIPVATTGFLFSLFTLIFITKIISALISNRVIPLTKSSNKAKRNPQEQIVEIRSEEESIKEGRFCQSCGTTLRPKDSKYCPQCGASI